MVNAFLRRLAAGTHLRMNTYQLTGSSECKSGASWLQPSEPLLWKSFCFLFGWELASWKLHGQQGWARGVSASRMPKFTEFLCFQCGYFPWGLESPHQTLSSLSSGNTCLAFGRRGQKASDLLNRIGVTWGSDHLLNSILTNPFCLRFLLHDHVQRDQVSPISPTFGDSKVPGGPAWCFPHCKLGTWLLGSNKLFTPHPSAC